MCAQTRDEVVKLYDKPARRAFMGSVPIGMKGYVVWAPVVVIHKRIAHVVAAKQAKHRAGR
jgi:hypothetical protein